MEKAELIAELKKAGLQEGVSLEVHSSLSSFGFVGGGADTVIDALMECVTEQGSILLCKSIAKYEMRHFLAPAGQPKKMRKNFMRRTFAIFHGAP